MIGLLQNFEKPSSRLTGTEVDAAYLSNQRFQLKELLIEELVKSLYHYNMAPSELDLDDLVGVMFFSTDLVKTHKRFIKDKGSLLRQVHEKGWQRESTMGAFHGD